MTTSEHRDSPALSCRELTVAYGSRIVLRQLDLIVQRDEAMAVLGPSGCGKTTLLYTVAGFQAPQAGEVRIGGRLVAAGQRNTPPEDRSVGVVFQNYALWPHLSALDTVAYPLRRDGVPKAAARRQAAGLLDRMGIGHLAASRPAQLSGGEQQRVGVARALARRAALYLFDEPTAHLDTALRTVLHEELANQRSAIGAALLYATHDVAEAFVVSDRVALLRNGVVVQLGDAQEVYERPVDLWAARLTGPASVLAMTVVAAERGRVSLAMVGGEITVDHAGPVPGPAVQAGPLEPGPVQRGPVRVLVRPEWGRLTGALPGRVTAVRYRGSDTDYRLETPAGPVEVRERGGPRARVGDPLGWTLHRAWLLPDDSVLAADQNDHTTHLARG